MEMSQTIANLAKALAQFQMELKSPPKNKTATIKTGGGASYIYTFADLPSLMEYVLKLLAKFGLSISQVTDEGCLYTMLMHESGEWIRGRIKFNPWVKPQEYGSQLTYFRRYAISAMLGIASDEDNDANELENHNETTIQQVAKRVQTAQKESQQKPGATHTKVSTGDALLSATSPPRKDGFSYPPREGYDGNTKETIPNRAIPFGTGDDYTVNFGKYTGKKLKDIGHDQLRSYVDYLSSMKAQKSETKVFIEEARAFLLDIGSASKQANVHDDSDGPPPWVTENVPDQDQIPF